MTRIGPRLVRFSPDHFWLCPIPFVLEYPNQPDHFSLYVRFNRTTPNLVAPALLGAVENVHYAITAEGLSIVLILVSYLSSSV